MGLFLGSLDVVSSLHFVMYWLRMHFPLKLSLQGVAKCSPFSKRTISREVGCSVELFQLRRQVLPELLVGVTARKLDYNPSDALCHECSHLQQLGS